MMLKSRPALVKADDPRLRQTKSGLTSLISILNLNVIDVLIITNPGAESILIWQPFAILAPPICD